MPSAFQFQCHFILIFLAASKGETRYLEVSNGHFSVLLTAVF